MDPTWLDLFAEAARSATDRDVPPDLIDVASSSARKTNVR